MEEIKISGLDEVIYHDVCDNGLNVYMWVNKKSNNFYATLNVKYGSIDTEFRLKDQKEYTKVPEGIAHFLEHQMFEEENGKTAHEYFSKLGSSINAFTTFDFTCYLVMASTKFKENVEYLLNFVQKPYFIEEKVEKEKGIIIEEINMYQDNPDQQLFYKTHQCIYQKDKCRNDILGTIDSVNAITPKELNLIHKLFYHPANMFLVLTGNFNPEEAITIIKENQGKKKFSKWQEPEKKVPKEPIQVNEKYLELEQNIEIPRITLSYKMDRKKFGKIEDTHLTIYLNVLLRAKFGTTSDLREELLKNELIFGGISYSVTIKPEVVVIKLKTITNYPKEIIKKLHDNMHKLRLTDTFLRRAKKRNIAAIVVDYDNIETINSVIQDDLVAYDKIIDNAIDIYKELDLTTAKNIIDNIDLTNFVTIIANPKKTSKE